jgi:hypothetical protein
MLFTWPQFFPYERNCKESSECSSLETLDMSLRGKVLAS